MKADARGALERSDELHLRRHTDENETEDRVQDSWKFLAQEGPAIIFLRAGMKVVRIKFGKTGDGDLWFAAP